MNRIGVVGGIGEKSFEKLLSLLVFFVVRVASSALGRRREEKNRIGCQGNWHWKKVKKA
jgi:hypothetical protein